jgi:hypothetical protein
LATLANTTFNPNDQLVIQLPEGLVDLSTFTLQGKVTTAGGAAHGVYTPPVECLIDSVYVEIGGVGVQTGFTSYAELFNIFRDYQMWDKKSLRGVLQLDNAPMGAETTASNYTCSAVPFACYNWLGFLGSVKMLDTTIIPPVKIYLRLAPNAVLAQHAGNASTNTYQLTEVRAQVDILDISDNLYYNMISQRLAQAPLELPFTNFTTVNGSTGAQTQTTRFSTSTDCLTDVIATFKHTNALNNAWNSNSGLSSYFDRTAFGLTSSGFKINGIPYPSIPCESAFGESFIDTAHTFNVAQDLVCQTNPNMKTLSLWNSNFFTHGHTFSYPEDDDGHRLIGLSGKGNMISGSWETAGTGSSLTPLMWLKHKSVLRIGSGKMVTNFAIKCC